MLEKALDYEGLKYYDGKSKDYIEEKDNTTLEEAKTYTDTRVANLVGTAPDTLNTLEELAEAIEEHQEVADLLTEAIGNKANKTDLDSHTQDISIHITQEEKDNLATKESVNELEQTISELNATAIATGSPILLTDSADGVLIDFKGYGRSTQNGTPTPDSPIAIKSVADSGYFDVELLQGYYNTDGSVNGAAQYVSAKNLIPCNVDDVIKFTYAETVTKLVILFFDDTKYLSQVGADNSSIVNVTAPSGATRFGITIQSVNGITPTNAKPITVTINGKYALIVKSRGKNWVDVSSLSWKANNASLILIDKVHLTPNSYTLSWIQDKTLASVTRNTPCYNKTSNSDVIYQNSSENHNLQAGKYNWTFTIKEEDDYSLQYWIHTPNVDVSISNIQLEVGTVTTDYEPYKEEVKYIPLNEPLRSSLDGSVRDVVDLGKCEVTRRIIKKRITQVSKNNSTNANNYCYYATLGNVGKSGVGLSNTLSCVSLSEVTSDGTDNIGMYVTSLYDGVVYINVGKHLTENTVEGMTKWLSENPTYIQYELAEPITEEIEPIDIDTFEGVTHISCSDGAEMEIEYFRNSQDGQVLADVQTKLQSQIDELSNLDANKVDKVSGKELSTNDFTDAYKTKLDGIATGANKTVVDSALSATSTNPVQNKLITNALSGKANKLETDASTAAAAGWYRIAATVFSQENAVGVFKIVGAVSGYHTTAIITAGISYGTSPNIQVLQCSNFSNAAITKARIVYHSTYQNNYAYLEVYKAATSATSIAVSLIERNSWSLVAPSTAGSVPSGYSTKEITLTANAISAETFVGALSGNATTATTATQLGSNAGSTTQPVYFSGGKPVATTYTLGKSVPSNAVFTDTTYSAATQSAQGLMSAADKKKLDGVAAGANAYSHPTTSGNKHIPAGGSSGQILRWSADGTAVWGADSNTTYSVASTTSNGLMSSTDKSKLDGIATGANKYTHPSYTAKSSGLYKVTVDSSGHVSGTSAVAKTDITALGIPAQDTTYSNFVKSGSGAKAGLVPAPSTTAGTTKYLREDGTWQTPPTSSVTVDSALSSTSTNPVQNKVINTALSDKANSSHTHAYLPLVGGTLTGDVAIPVAKSNLDSSIPVSSGTCTISSISELSKFKTYIGSMMYSNTWNDIISVRHRNGYADGNNYGMYIRSALTTEGHLLWGKQYGTSNWQAERTILDSSNYANYPHSKVLDAGDGRAITFAYSKDGMSTTSWLASWNGAQLESISPANALKAAGGVSTSGGTITGDFVVEKDLRVTDNYGIEDRKGNGLLYRNTNAVTLGSATNKTPVYVGTVDGNDITYIRGKYTVIGGSDLNYSSKPIYNLSDQRIKTNESLISEEIDKYIDFFDKLQPRKYNYIRDEEDKAKTIGFFAQEVHQALLDSGLELEDFAGVNIEESFVEGWGEGTDEAMWYEDFYSLAYEQFIPIIVSKIQHMEQQYNNKLKALEEEYNNKLVSLEERLRKLEEV